jgi:hypothetical protein
MSRNDPDPRCMHVRTTRRVTNVPDGEYIKGRAIRSTWVCGRRMCVLDAAAWVERQEAGKALVYNEDGIEVSL